MADSDSREVILNDNENNKCFQTQNDLNDEINDEMQKTHCEPEEMEDGSQDSPADYEYSLRIENIRLKSRLEQAKEQIAVIEREKKRYLDEYEKEKEFADKTNTFNHKLLNEKRSLQEELKRRQKSLHHDDIKEVVAKLEHEIYVLEDRLERQRKRYQQEHIMLYEDLKVERRKQQDWKHTYMKSQLAIMAFRRKLHNMKDRISPEDKRELQKCLEIPVDDQEDRLTQLETIDATLDLSTTVNNLKNQDHFSSKKYINRLSVNSNSVDLQYQSNSPYSPNHSLEGTESLNKNNGDLNNQHDKDTFKQQQHERDPDERNTPKVFIIEGGDFIEAKPVEHVQLHSPKEHVRVQSSEYTRHSLSPRSTESINHRSASLYRQDTLMKYELDGNKYHTVSFSEESSQRSSHRSSYDKPSTRYRHWHTYSIDNPGHQRAQHLTNHIHQGATSSRHEDLRCRSPAKDVFLSVNHASDPHRHGQFTTDNNSDRLELNAEDTKFLELKFDNTFLKTDYNSSSVSSVKPPYVNHHFDDKMPTPAGTPLENKKIWCLTCDGEVTKRPCGHKNLVIQEKEKEFPCPTCGRLFNNRSHLKRHNMIHSGEKPWACNYCDKRFNRKSHLNRHLLTHTGEKPFKCPYCEKGFADNSDLKRHKQVHESTPGFVAIRPKEFVVMSSEATNLTGEATITIPTVPHLLTSQIQAKRKEERRFPCSKCGKVFTRKSHLTRHKLTHNQQKIYCDCGRTFRQNSHLQAHLPACKRKREAAEAKYNAENGLTSMSQLGRPASGLHETDQTTTNNKHVSNQSSISPSSELTSVDHSNEVRTIKTECGFTYKNTHGEDSCHQNSEYRGRQPKMHKNGDEDTLDRSNEFFFDDDSTSTIKSTDLNFGSTENSALNSRQHYGIVRGTHMNSSLPGIPPLIPDPVEM